MLYETYCLLGIVYSMFDDMENRHLSITFKIKPNKKTLYFSESLIPILAYRRKMSIKSLVRYSKMMLTHPACHKSLYRLWSNHDLLQIVLGKI